MSDENQIVVPPSFIALYVPAGRIKPSEPREFIAQRHEFCEDLVTALSDTAQTQLWSLSITQADVLERIARGLVEPGVGLTAVEADWVMHRLAEVLGWEDPNPGQ